MTKMMGVWGVVVECHITIGEVLTVGVELSCLQGGLVDHELGAVGQLQHTRLEAVGGVVLEWSQTRAVHQLHRHRERVALDPNTAA